MQGGRRRRNASDLLMGRCLWRERLLAGLSREDLGGWLGISAEAIRQYEYGEDRMSPPELALIAGRLGVPLSFFCAIDEETAVPPERAAMEEVRRLSARRSLSLLSTPAFARARPLFEFWQATRGELTEDVHRVVVAQGLLHRTVLARRLAHSPRFITEHFGAGIMIMRPCESLLIVGRELSEQPDRDYGAWVAEAYAETSWTRRPRLESVRAFVRTSAGTTLRTRYDRVLMPWRGDGNDQYVMCLSIQREVPVVVPALAGAAVPATRP